MSGVGKYGFAVSAQALLIGKSFAVPRVKPEDYPNIKLVATPNKIP